MKFTKINLFSEVKTDIIISWCCVYSTCISCSGQRADTENIYRRYSVIYSVLWSPLVGMIGNKVASSLSV